MCVLPKLVRRASRSCPVQKTDAGETVSLPAVLGRQQVDASGGKAVTRVCFLNGFLNISRKAFCSESVTSKAHRND